MTTVQFGRLLPKTSLLILALSLLLSLGTPSMSRAEGPALTPVGGTNFNQGSYSLGWHFTANSNLSVTALGFYDAGGNGLTESHPVGIYDLSCNLIATTTVTPSDPLVGRFRYHALNTPVTLNSGQTYYVAAVNGTEPYLISASDVGADASVNFGGFSIFGNTEVSTTLKCPNGSQSPGFKGDFGPTFYIGALPPEIPDSDDDNDPNKRNTALTMICNRGGAGLRTATCTATIADTGAPPRSLPTGSIDWEATDGFSPTTSQCLIAQTQFSPGIGACTVEFTVPEGFPIGTKFPITASYSGDTTFNGSTTGHKLIVAKCVSIDPANPCPNSIGLSFAGTPAITKAKIKAFISCGSASSETSQATGEPPVAAAETGGACAVSGLLALNVAKLFENLSFEDAKKIGETVTDEEAKVDTLMFLLKNAEDVRTAERWKILQETQSAIRLLVDDVVKNRVEARKDLENAYDRYIRSSPALIAAAKKGKFDRSLKSKTVKVNIQADKQKSVTFTLPSRMKKLAAVFMRAETTLPLEITVTAKQKKRKGNATVTESVDFAVQ